MSYKTGLVSGKLVSLKQRKKLTVLWLLLGHGGRVEQSDMQGISFHSFSQIQLISACKTNLLKSGLWMDETEILNGEREWRLHNRNCKN